jgi:hypothetical protein
MDHNPHPSSAMLHDCLRFPVLVFALCTPSLAQSYVSSPPSLLNVEGPTFASKFGAYSNSRYMLFDGELRNSAIGIKEVAVRDDYYPYTKRNGMGRRWTDVTLAVSLCDTGNLSSIFANNATSTPTRVFSGSVTWGTNTGHPGTLPAQWTKSFPFSTTWAYNGKKDISLDFDFNGGTMANNASWSTKEMHEFFLDAYPTFTRAEGVQVFHGNGGRTGGCLDGNSTLGGLNFLHCIGYGANYHVPAYRNKFQLYTFSYYTAPRAPVANIVNFKGSAAGITFPSVVCNKLHLDPTKFLMIGISNANGPGAWSGYFYPTKTSEGLIAYNSAYVGLSMWAQGYWIDSTKNAIRLTRAVNTRIPWVPRAVNRSALFQPLTHMKNSTGYGPFSGERHNPILRYAN